MGWDVQSSWAPSLLACPRGTMALRRRQRFVLLGLCCALHLESSAMVLCNLLDFRPLHILSLALCALLLVSAVFQSLLFISGILHEL